MNVELEILIRRFVNDPALFEQWRKWAQGRANEIHNRDDRRDALAFVALTEAMYETVKGGVALIVAAPELYGVLWELVNSPNAKSNDLWDRARAVLAKAAT